jgi:hypothetical protein
MQSFLPPQPDESTAYSIASTSQMLPDYSAPMLAEPLPSDMFLDFLIEPNLNDWLSIPSPVTLGTLDPAIQVKVLLLEFCGLWLRVLAWCSVLLQTTSIS